MKEALKNVVLGGVGVTVYAKEAAESIIKKLVEKGKATLNEKEISDAADDVVTYIKDKIHSVAKAAEEKTRPPQKKVDTTKPNPKKDKTKSKQVLYILINEELWGRQASTDGDGR